MTGSELFVWLTAVRVLGGARQRPVRITLSLRTVFVRPDNSAFVFVLLLCLEGGVVILKRRSRYLRTTRRNQLTTAICTDWIT